LERKVKKLILIEKKKHTNNNLKVLQITFCIYNKNYLTYTIYIFMPNIAGQVYRNGGLVITNDTGLVNRATVIRAKSRRFDRTSRVTQSCRGIIIYRS